MSDEKTDKPVKKKSKLLAKIRRNNENGARLSIIEDLFNDFYLRRHKVYWFNFVRGLFFGFGSVLGGTVVVAIVIWILSQLGHWPGVGDFFDQLRNTLKQSPR